MTSQEYVELVPAVGAAPAIGTLTFRFKDDSQGEALLGLVTDYGVWRNYVMPYPSPLGNVTRGGEVMHQPAPSSFRAETGWLESWDAGKSSTYIYSNEELHVRFTFARSASRALPLTYGPDSLYKTYLTASTATLPAGSSSVDVIFRFKKGVNPTLRNEIVARARGDISEQLYAKVKDDDGSYGIAYTTTALTPFDALEATPSFIPPSTGFEGSVDLGISGGSDSTRVYLPWKEKWVLPTYTWTQADKFAIFESDAYILIKDPNTGSSALTIYGPNNRGGNPGGTPVPNHGVTLESHANLEVNAGKHWSTNQSFTFNVRIPESLENELVLDIVGWIDGLEVPSSARWEAISIGNNLLNVLVSNITTDIRISIRFTTSIKEVDVPSIWSSDNTLTITSSAAGLAKIYSIRGSLVKEFAYREGSTSITLPAGIYIVTLHNGSNNKIIIK
jgi:hypothetical protein